MLRTLKLPEITEYTLPAYFFGFAYKFTFYNVFSGVPAYHSAEIFGGHSELVWTIIFTFAGAFQLYSTLLRRLQLRRSALIVSALILWFWAIGIIVTRSSGFGDIVWTMLAIKTSWTLARLDNSPVR